LKIKYEDVCAHVNAGTQQLQCLQAAFDQISRRCEQLEDEKVEKSFIYQ
jgi:hypothetical protein